MSTLSVTLLNRVHLLDSSSAQLSVWDEAPMAHKHVAKCMDRKLRDLCSCVLPFGGINIVFGGNFSQIIPVLKRASKDELSACPNRSSLWRHVKLMRLTINMRVQKLCSQDSLEVSEFSNFLLRQEKALSPRMRIR